MRIPEEARTPTPSVVWALVALNVAVYVAWQTLGREGAGLDLMADHFLVSASSMAHLRVWTALTSAFSHMDPGHLLANMLALWVFGADVARVVGASRFVMLYVVGGVLASLAHVAFSLATGDPTPALGASGAVMAISAIFGLTFPRRILLVQFFVPVPALLAVAFYIVADVFGLFGGGGRVAHAAHLGGAVWGALYWWWAVRPRLRPRPRRRA